MHTFRDKLACNMSPLFLRLALAVVFIWAGLAKVMGTMPVTPDQADILQSYGLLGGSGPAPTDAAPEPETPPAVEEVTPDDTDDEPAFIDDPAPAEDPDGDASTDDDSRSAWLDHSPYTLTPISYQPAEQPSTTEVKALHRLTLMLHDASDNEKFDPASGEQVDPIWPSSLGKGTHWPRTLAWAAALTELVAGVLCLIGFLTRFSALAIAGIMATAFWLTVAGPAIQSGDTFLGFLPNKDLLDLKAWTTPLWQLTLFLAALSLFFSGAGGASLDALLFPRHKKPKPAKKSAEE